jgi:PAS domain S-box-containing protein
LVAAVSIDYRLMIEAAPEAIIVYTPEKFLFLNSFAASRLGSDPASLVGKPIMGFVHPVSVPIVLQRLQDVVRTGQPGPPLEVRFVSRTGEVIPSEIISVPVLFDGQKALLGLIRDISRRAEAEQALRESEEKFANAFRQSPHGMAFVDLNGKFIKANQVLCDMLGYTEAELFELRFADITHVDDVAVDLEQLSRLVNREIKSYHRIKRYHRKDGEVIWISLGVSAVHGVDGKPIYFIGQMQDITLHREREEERATEQRRAGIMETTIAVAHEMNNVLTVLMMNAELLAHDATPQEIPEIAEEILGAATRIAAVVQKLRQASEPRSVEYLGKEKMLDLSEEPKVMRNKGKK